MIYCYLTLEATMNTLGRGVFKKTSGGQLAVFTENWLPVVPLVRAACQSLYSSCISVSAHVKYTVALGEMSFIF